MSNASANEKSENQKPEAEKPWVTLPGTVDKVIPSTHPAEPEKAQIVVEGADHLYREIRVANTLQDENGNEVALKPGAEVEVTIEADLSETTPKGRHGWDGNYDGHFNRLPNF
jgi:hypothetical protein